MKTTKSESKIEIIERLKKILDKKAKMAKEEKELKAMVYEFLGDEEVLKAGEYTVISNTVKRTDLDKKSLLVFLGEEKIKEFQKQTSYKTLKIKAA